MGALKKGSKSSLQTVYQCAYWCTVVALPSLCVFMIDPNEELLSGCIMH